MTNELSKLYITNADIAEKDIASLRDAPNRGHTYGTNNLSASDLKARFDSLPKLLIERFNALLDKIKDGSLSEELKVDAEGTLAELKAKVDALLEGGGGVVREEYRGEVTVEDIIPLVAPVIECTGGDGLKISYDPDKIQRVDKWGIYYADGSLMKYIECTGAEQSVSANYSTSCYVTSVDANGAESPASNIVTTEAECFPAGTPVLMADGSYKMIEEIAVGDTVQSYDLEAGTYCDGYVTAVVIGYTTRIAMLLLSDGSYIAMAEGHPLYTADGWHSLTNKNGYPTLAVGDKILSAFGYIEITELGVVDTEETAVYSLSVSTSPEQDSLSPPTAEDQADDEPCKGVYFAGTGFALAAPTHS